ncbi:MAG: ATP synthase F1 subunit epsilon [Anaerovoracaceae bacterium]|nr:ATP synthase F1 subunit epsilon [Clostridiales bacterium]
MANPIKLEVITPSKLFYKGEVEMVVCPTLEGYEGFMANHTWACKLLGVGELWIQECGSDDFKIAAISGGYIDVKDSIVLFTDAAEWPEAIDVERARQLKQDAEEWLRGDKGDANEIAMAKYAIEKAITRMSVAEGGMRRKK